jgi:glycine cleavage system H protein
LVHGDDACIVTRSWSIEVRFFSNIELRLTSIDTSRQDPASRDFVNDKRNTQTFFRRRRICLWQKIQGGIVEVKVEIKDDLKYTKEHEWVKVEGDIATVGITDYAQKELGDVVFVELPQVGTNVEQMKPFGVIEAVKAVSDLFSPLTGEVTEVNTQLESQSNLINSDPYRQGWIIKIKMKDPKELEALLSSADYRKLVESKT